MSSVARKLKRGTLRLVELEDGSNITVPKQRKFNNRKSKKGRKTNMLYKRS